MENLHTDVRVQTVKRKTDCYLRQFSWTQIDRGLELADTSKRSLTKIILNEWNV